jgi:hypothetical protein
MTNQDQTSQTHVEVFATEGMTQGQAAPHIEVINALLKMGDDQLPKPGESISVSPDVEGNAAITGFIVKSGAESYVFGSDCRPVDTARAKLDNNLKFDG